MILETLSYSQFQDGPRSWGFRDLRLHKLNLIVGKNAIGKTRVLNVIAGLARLISGETKLIFSSGDYVARFTHDNCEIVYRLAYEDKEVYREEFEIDGNTRLERGEGGVGKIFADKLNSMVEFQSPENELAVVNRSDSIQHPFFQSLSDWGKNTYHYAFGTPLGRESLAVLVEDKTRSDFDPKQTDQVIVILRRGLKEYGEAFKAQIIQDMKAVGYELSDIGVQAPSTIRTGSPLPGQLVGLYVKEAGLLAETEQLEMSQGMFRVLSIVIQLAYNQKAMNPGCVLIDDIGEGLDFERASAFIKLIGDRSSTTNTQYILSTNDRFTMNSVPLKDWTVLGRDDDGHVCKIYNYENSRERFEEFRFTGLANFDLLATDFLTSNGNNDD